MITKTANRTRLAMSGTTYDFDFRIDAATDLEVYGIVDNGDGTETSTEITTGFSVTFSSADEEGTVTFDAEPTTYDYILMLRNREYTQDTDIPIRGGFSEEDIENALDRIVIQIQQLKELSDYAVKQSSTAVAVDIVFPQPKDGKAILWNGTSGALKNSETDVDDIDAAVTAAEAAQTAAEAAQTAAEAAQGAAEAAQAGAEAAALEAAGYAEVRGTFTNADLSTGVLTITHNLGLSAPYTLTLEIHNNSSKRIYPDDITGSANSVAVDLTSYGTISGTWGYAYKG